jgi:hypothetical protein
VSGAGAVPLEGGRLATSSGAINGSKARQRTRNEWLNSASRSSGWSESATDRRAGTLEQNRSWTPNKRLWTAADRLRSTWTPPYTSTSYWGSCPRTFRTPSRSAARSSGSVSATPNDYYLGEDVDELMAGSRRATTPRRTCLGSSPGPLGLHRANAKVAAGTVLSVRNGKTQEYVQRHWAPARHPGGSGRENPRLKNVLEKSYAQRRIDDVLPSLIDLISEIPFSMHRSTPKTSSGTSTSTSSANSRWPKARRADSTTRRSR